MKKKPVRIIVDVANGMVSEIYGDRLPEGVEFEFIVRDKDVIGRYEPDPLEESYVPQQYFW